MVDTRRSAAEDSGASGGRGRGRGEDDGKRPSSSSPPSSPSPTKRPKTAVKKVDADSLLPRGPYVYKEKQISPKSEQEAEPIHCLSLLTAVVAVIAREILRFGAREGKVSTMSSLGTSKGILEIAKFGVYVAVPVSLTYLVATDSKTLNMLMGLRPYVVYPPEGPRPPPPEELRERARELAEARKRQQQTSGQCSASESPRSN